MRAWRLLACGAALVLTFVGTVPVAWAQDYVGPASGGGGDQADGAPGSGEAADYVGGDYVGGDYVGVEAAGGQAAGVEEPGVDQPGVASAGVPAPLRPRVPDRGRGAFERDGGPLLGARPDEEGPSVRGLPVSTTDAVVLGLLVIAGVAVAVRRARVSR